jgi:hypothetical protein
LMTCERRPPPRAHSLHSVYDMTKRTRGSDMLTATAIARDTRGHAARDGSDAPPPSPHTAVLGGERKIEAQPLTFFSTLARTSAIRARWGQEQGRYVVTTA